jgi:hypothetical protein
MPPKKPKSKKGFSATHKKLLTNLRASATALDIDSLGHGNAVTIVCACANTSPLNLARTLKQLGVNGDAFQGCVFRSVTQLGFDIDEDAIPDSPDTTLIQVVDVIEDAPAKVQG